MMELWAARFGSASADLLEGQAQLSLDTGNLSPARQA